MNYFTHTVDDNICKWLLDNKFPLTKCIRNDHNESLYYTLPYEDSDGWQYCDAYYKPTYFDVKEWLYKEHNILINSNIYTDSFSVQIRYKSKSDKYFGNCWEIGYGCKTFEDCLKSAIEYIIENNILNEKSTE